jgi:hypothetical protein
VCNDSKNELMQEIGDVRVLTMKKKIQSIKRSLDIFSKLSFFVVLGFEFRAYTLSHSTSPFFYDFFFPNRVSQTICPAVLELQSSWISASE